MVRFLAMFAITLGVMMVDGSPTLGRDPIQKHTTMIGNSRYGRQFNRGYGNYSRGYRGYSFYGGGPYSYGYGNGSYYNGYGNGVYFNGYGNPGYFNPYYPNGPRYPYGSNGVFDNDSFFYR